MKSVRDETFLCHKTIANKSKYQLFRDKPFIAATNTHSMGLLVSYFIIVNISTQASLTDSVISCLCILTLIVPVPVHNRDIPGAFVGY